MKVEVTESFQKAIAKQPGQIKTCVGEAIKNVMEAKTVTDIPECKKLVSLKTTYRI